MKTDLLATERATSFRKGSIFRYLKGQRGFILMALPAILLTFLFSYTPMFGVILAFKNFRYDLGVFGSKWVGFNNFKFFFESQDAWRITRNTVGLNAIFIVAGLICSVTVAILLFQIKNRISVKAYQTTIILPNFLSWVIVAYMSYALLSPNYGVINSVIRSLGGQGVDWYTRPELWPFILTLHNLWKTVGINSVIYYAALMGIDQEHFEAAEIDGANKWQISTKIIVPSLVPVMVIMTILAIGGIFRADFGLFYQVTRDVGILYPTTDVIDTYVYRSLKQVGDIGMSTAVGLYQSLVGFVMVLLSNYIVKKIDSDNALF